MTAGVVSVALVLASSAAFAAPDGGDTIVLQVLAAALAFVRDRSTRERLLRRILRSRTPALDTGVRAIDVTASARRLRWQHRGGVLLRNAGLAALVVATYGLPSRWQLGIILGLGFAGSMVELVVARVSRRSGLRAAYGTGALVARVLTSTLTTGLFGFAAMLLLVPVVSAGLVLPGYTAAQTRSTIMLFLPLGLFMVGLADLVSRAGRRLALRSARSILARDARPEILFLRSFMDDQFTVRAHRTGRQSVLDGLTLRRFEQFEDILAWALWKFGPVVAFGDHWLPPLGAARVSVPQGVDWRAMVWNRLPSSQP